MIANKLILGTAQLGLNYGINNFQKKPSINSSIKILNKAFSQGIRCLDTAESYGDSHSIIGEYHSLNPDKKFLINDKISFFRNKDLENFDANINHKLSELNIDYFNGLMFHSSSILYKNEKLVTKMFELKKLGKIKKIGLSIYKNSEIVNVLQKNYQLDFVQMPFNVLDNEALRKDVIKMMIDKGIEIHVRSIFLQGLFYMNENCLPKKLLPLKKYIDKIKMICIENNHSIDELLMNYPKQKKYVSKIIFGVDNENQLIKNIASYNKNITFPMKKIDEIYVNNKELLNPSKW